jgi:hypothetical protein
MGSRYTKSIPKSVYFCKEGAWWAGPFVHPQKGRQCVEYKLVPVNQPVTESPIPVITNKPVSQEELDRLAEWLKSNEGEQKIKEAQKMAQKFSEELNKMFDVDPKLLTEPFNI